MEDDFPADLSSLTYDELSNLNAKYSARLYDITGLEVVAGPACAGVGVADYIHWQWAHRASRCFLGPLHNIIGPIGAVVGVLGGVYTIHKFIQLGSVNERIGLINAEIQRRAQAAAAAAPAVA